MTPKAFRYTECYQNDEPFVVFIQDFQNAKKCMGCSNDFLRRMLIAPYDIALLHEERYAYTKQDGQGNVEMVPTHKTKAKRFYCIDKKCILGRHPYFWRGLIQVSTDVRKHLQGGHKDLPCFDLNFLCEDSNIRLRVTSLN